MNRQTFGRIQSNSIIYKTQSISNPFHPDEINLNKSVVNLSQFNDRNKMRLTQQLDSDSQGSQTKQHNNSQVVNIDLPIQTQIYQSDSDKIIASSQKNTIKIGLQQNQEKSNEETQFQLQIIQDEVFSLNDSQLSNFTNQIQKVQKNSLSSAKKVYEKNKSMASQQSFIKKIPPSVCLIQSQAFEQLPKRNRSNRKRRKIFGNQYRKQISRSPHTVNAHTSNTNTSNIGTSPYQKPYVYKNTEQFKVNNRSTQISQYSRIAHCYHQHHNQQAILKSLSIIDKLSEQKIKKEVETTKLQRYKLINGEIIEINLQIELFLINITLEQISLQQNRNKVNIMNNKTMQILKKVREQRYFSHSLQLNSEPINQSIKIINQCYKKINIMIIVQQKVGKWKQLLNEQQIIREYCDKNIGPSKVERKMSKYIENLKKDIIDFDENTECRQMNNFIKKYKNYLNSQIETINQFLHSRNR